MIERTTLRYQKQMAKKDFEDFEAEYHDFGNIATLNWRHKSGTRNYFVRYVFDKQYYQLYISGDLGSAVVALTEEPTLEALAKYVNSVSYFVEKISCSTDLYLYDEDLAKETLEEYFKEHFTGDGVSILDEFEITADEFVRECIKCMDRFSGFHLSEELESMISMLDPDYYEWFYRAGKYYDPRIILWLVGLNMAYEQLRD